MMRAENMESETTLVQCSERSLRRAVGTEALLEPGVLDVVWVGMLCRANQKHGDLSAR